MIDPIAEFETALEALAAAHLIRTRPVIEAVDGAHLRVDGQAVLAFCSNDYLGLSQHPALIEAARQGALAYGVGAGASPLVSGHSAATDALEQELAAFVRLPRALYFGSGYVANVGLIPALVGRGDAVFSDALNHACLIDGVRLSRADAHVYPHNDLPALTEALQRSTARRKLIVTDSVFSMDGDMAALAEMITLCERHDAWLLVDDAHGFGVLGPEGRGTLAHLDIESPRLIYMATLGKAAGVAGAFVAGHATLIEWLMQRVRSYIFATATPAMVTEALRASIRVIEQDAWRRAHLHRLIARLRAGTADLPWRHPESGTAIQPLIIGGNAEALTVMNAIRLRGIWVPAIRPPTVPEGTARLRISLSAAHTEADVDRLLAVLHDIA